MKPGKDTLWSSDLAIPRAPDASPIIPATVQRGSAPGMKRQAPMAPAQPDPLRERAYLRYGVPALQVLLSCDGEARLHTLSDTLADRIEGFDFDDLRRALRELVERGAVTIRESDNRKGDHLYAVTPTGRVLAG